MMQMERRMSSEFGLALVLCPACMHALIAELNLSCLGREVCGSKSALVRSLFVNVAAV